MRPRHKHLLLSHYVPCCSVELSWLLHWWGSVAESEASVSEPPGSLCCWCAQLCRQPAGWYPVCNYPQIYPVHNGGVSCFVGCGSCSTQALASAGGCQPSDGLVPVAGVPPYVSLAIAFHRLLLVPECRALPSLGTTLVPSAAPVPIYSSTAVCACRRCTSIPL